MYLAVKSTRPPLHSTTPPLPIISFIQFIYPSTSPNANSVCSPSAYRSIPFAVYFPASRLHSSLNCQIHPHFRRMQSSFQYFITLLILIVILSIITTWTGASGERVDKTNTTERRTMPKKEKKNTSKYIFENEIENCFPSLALFSFRFFPNNFTAKIIIAYLSMCLSSKTLPFLVFRCDCVIWTPSRATLWAHGPADIIVEMLAGVD